MTDLKEKIKTALDESRMLILGIQVLLGFQYRVVFETGFEKLPDASRLMNLVSLSLLLLGTALLMSPGAFHRIVAEGRDTRAMQRYATRVMDVALAPFALALGLDLLVATRMLAGITTGLVVGFGTALVALLFWYGLEFWKRQQRTPKEKAAMKDAGSSSTSLKDKIEHVLTEARVILPGVQALLGFQLSIMLMQGFDSLPPSSKYIHLISLALMALCIILLMSPAAYHRIVERGEDTEDMHRFASRMLLFAMVPLPLGISGDFYVVVKKAMNSTTAAGVGSIVILLLFYGLWFGYMIYRKQKAHA
jgi:hypothetical protein